MADIYLSTIVGSRAPRCRSRTVSTCVMLFTFLPISVVDVVSADENATPAGKGATAKVIPGKAVPNDFETLPLERKNWIKASVAIQNDKVEVLKQLLDQDPDLATRPIDPLVLTTLLHHACKHDKPESIKILLKQGADVLAKTGWDQETPLHVAARADSINAVKLLLDEGVDINIRGAGPRPKGLALIPVPFASPLDLAAAAGSERVVELLLERGAFVDVNPPKSTYSSLHRAVEGHHHFIGYGNLQRLLDPSLNAAPGNRKIIELLLKNGCDLNDLDFFNNTPFHVAVRRGDVEAVEYLLTSHGDDIDVDEPGQFDYTPLQLAVSELNAESQVAARSVIELLLKHGADRSRLGGPSNPQTTAFELAVQHNCGEPILKLLKP